MPFSEPLRQRLRRYVVLGGVAALIGYCLWAFDFSPARIWNGLGRLGNVLAFMFPPQVWQTLEAFSEILKGLGETLSIAFMGTLLGAIIAFPLSFLGVKDINRLNVFRLGVRRGYDLIRAFENLILALIFIRAFGLGPLAGILAIAVSEDGTFANSSRKRLKTRPINRSTGSRIRAGHACKRSVFPLRRR